MPITDQVIDGLELQLELEGFVVRDFVELGRAPIACAVAKVRADRPLTVRNAVVVELQVEGWVHVDRSLDGLHVLPYGLHCDRGESQRRHVVAARSCEET